MDDLKFVAVLALVIMALIGVTTFVCYQLDSHVCTSFGRATGMQTKYDWGCYAWVNDQWIPRANVFGTAHEVRIKAEK